jgi:transposase
MTKEELQKRLDSLESLLAARDKEIEFLKARIAKLEKRLGLDSSTSSKPPSSDGLRKKPYTQSLRIKGKNLSGGQKGHKGHSLNQVEQPDEVVNHKVSICPECKRDLEVAAVDVTIKRQVFDIPPMGISVTEHQAEVKVCDHCQKRVVGEFSKGVSAPAQYGERIKAMAVYLTHQQLIPEDRVQDVFRDLFGLSISTATIVKIGEAFAGKVAPYIEVVKDYLKKAPVKHVDETGFRIGGNTRWLHVLCNDKATVYRAAHHRGDIEEGLKGVVCHDYFRPYFRLKKVKHSLCNAHIL